MSLTLSVRAVDRHDQHQPMNSVPPSILRESEAQKALLP